MSKHLTTRTINADLRPALGSLTVAMLTDATFEEIAAHLWPGWDLIASTPDPVPPAYLLHHPRSGRYALHDFCLHQRGYNSTTGRAAWAAAMQATVGPFTIPGIRGIEFRLDALHHGLNGVLVATTAEALLRLFLDGHAPGRKPPMFGPGQDSLATWTVLGQYLASGRPDAEALGVLVALGGFGEDTAARISAASIAQDKVS